MLKSASKVPVRVQKGEAAALPEVGTWHPFDSLRRRMERLFDDFDRDFFWAPAGRSLFEGDPFWKGALSWGASPAVDVTEKDSAFEITAELPGMDEKDIEVVLSNGVLSIKGEKREEKEEKKKDYYLQERRFGSFERRFGLPEGVDPDKIDAKFRKGVLTVILPKKPEARKPQKKISVKTG